MSGNYAYLSMFDPYGVAIVDVSNPTNPVGVGYYPGNWVCMTAVGNYAYLAAAGPAGMRILDISNPSSPVVTGNYDPAWGVGGIEIAENYAYVGSDSGLRVLDISDFNSIREVGYYYIPNMPNDNDVVVREHIAYVACDAGGVGPGALRIFDCSAATTQPCPPTPLPFVDNFDSTTLDSCWFWIREDTSHWSLTERPGWMRIITQEGAAPPFHNVLLRSRPVADQYVIETHLQFNPLQNYQGAGITIWKTGVEGHYIQFVRHKGNYGQTVAILSGSECGAYLYVSCTVDDVYLRAEVFDTTATFLWSQDGHSWITVGQQTCGLLSDASTMIGLLAGNWISAPEIAADFDYFRVTAPDTTRRSLLVNGDGYVNCGSADSVRLVSSFTIDAFARFASTTAGYQTIVARDAGSGSYPKCFFEYNDPAHSPNRLSLNVFSGQNYNTYSDVWTPVIGRWYHIAVTLSNRVCTFYVDGQYTGSGSLFVDIPSIPSPLTIGWAEGTGTETNFSGELDNVRIWNRALSQEQIQAIRGCTFDSIPGLLASYHFDQQNGSTVYDSGPFGYNGTLVGNATTWPSDSPVSDTCRFLDISLISPNGGEQWTLFATDTVRWIGSGFAGNVMIEINRDYPGGAWDTLADDTPNDSVEPVFVGEPLSSHCRVRVTAIDAPYWDISDADFSIVTSQGYLALVRPAQPGTTALSWNAGTVECPNAALETFRLKNFGGASIVVYRPDEPASGVFSRVSACPTSFTLAAGQMSTCDVAVSFTPEADGTYRDSMRIRTNASNGAGGALWIPLTGKQITTPATPQVVITIQGNDAYLNWNPIVESVGECEIDVTHYLVFYAPTMGGPFYYHGLTTDTTYTHIGVVRYASGMFYNVIATTAPLFILQQLLASDDQSRLTQEQMLDLLHAQERSVGPR